MRAKLAPLPGLLLLGLAAGCVTSEGYKPARYQAAQSRFGAIKLTTDRKVYVCAAIDRLEPGNRAAFAPGFVPWEYATDAVELELKASGLAPVRAPLPSGAGLDDLRRIIAAQANRGEKAVYVGVELLVVSAQHWALDAKLFDPAGNLLFEKRAICVVDEVGERAAQEVVHMALRQVLADPKFQAGIAK
jgi:hypothetical protein